MLAHQLHERLQELAHLGLVAVLLHRHREVVPRDGLDRAVAVQHAVPVLHARENFLSGPAALRHRLVGVEDVQKPVVGWQRATRDIEQTKAPRFVIAEKCCAKS